MVGVRGSEELSWRVRSLCSSDRCSWVRGAGAAAHKVESRVRHFAGVAISPYKMAASTSTQQPQAGPRAAVPGQRLLFASDDFFIKGIVAAPRTQLPFAPTRSLTDEMLRGRRMMRWWRARVCRRVSRSGVSSYHLRRGCGARWWLAAVVNDSSWKQWIRCVCIRQSRHVVGVSGCRVWVPADRAMRMRAFPRV